MRSNGPKAHVKLLGDWESCQSAAEVFCKLAAHCKENFVTLLYACQLVFTAVFHKSMKLEIPQIIQLLDNSHSEVRQSAVNTFRGLAAHRKENRTSLYTVYLIINCSNLPRSHKAWHPGYH
jgi:hypothetical protein